MAELARTAAPETEVSQKQLVICIDDDPPVLSAIRRVLRHEPYELITTVDPYEVLDVVSRRKVNLIIADQRMPVMVGTDLLKAVRDSSPETACVILTGHADISDIAGAMNDGAVDRLIKKPWDDAEFRAMIRDLLARGRPGLREAEGTGTEAAEDTARVVIHVNCEGRTVAQVLSDISNLTHGPHGPPGRAAIVFDQLMRLNGSITVLLSEVLRQVVSSGVRVAMVDGTGAAGTFLELVGGSLPIVVYRSESELPDPKRILIVEDQEDNMEFLQILIESAGHQCEAVGSVAEAIKRLNSATFDLVLLDLVLPDAEGIEVARHILERGLGIPVIAISGFLDRWGDESFVDSGIRRQLSKPYRVKDILEAIRDS